MSQSEGFILPVVLILLMILSLMMIELYHIENAHLAIFQMVSSQEGRENLNKLEKQVLHQTEQNNKNADSLVPNPSNHSQSGRLYLRALDNTTHVRIWQEQIDNYRFTITCNEANYCTLMRNE